MKRTLPLAATLALTGCATAADMRGGKPFLETKAERPVDQVASCIALAWGETKNFNTRLERGADRTDVILSGSNVLGSDMVASVFDDGRVAMYRRGAIWSGMDNDRAADVRRCSALL